ncbi:MAG: hypothetical protein MI974_29015 [Chitinophagales bacterium]|nr:hypothetical protein [Chitinophagales bacterium]
MLSKILKLQGAKQLSKDEQQSIHGNGYDCGGAPGVYCNDGSYCCGTCLELGNNSYCHRP